jgi:hypothetical protein
MNLEKAAAVVTIIGFPLLIVSLFFAYILDGRISDQLTELKNVAASQNNIALNTMIFNNPTNVGIISDIENNKPILQKHGGQYTSTQLDNYLGDFDTVEFAYNEGLLNQDQLCDSFSNYLDEIASSTEVQEYLSANESYFSGVPALTKLVNSSKDSYALIRNSHP